MKMRNTLLALTMVSALAVTFLISPQQTHAQQQQKTAAGGGGGAMEYQPKLGFNGHMDYRGMVVDSVVVNSVAFQMGLETGDVVTHVNGKPVTSYHTYLTLLRDAVNYQNGRVSLQIENIRYYTGQSLQRYVHRTHYFPSAGGGGIQGQGGLGG